MDMLSTVSELKSISRDREIHIGVDMDEQTDTAQRRLIGLLTDCALDYLLS